MARRVKNSRRTLGVQKGAPSSPYIKRTLPFFDVLEEDQIARLEAQVDGFCRTLGLLFVTTPNQ